MKESGVGPAKSPAAMGRVFQLIAALSACLCSAAALAEEAAKPASPEASKALEEVIVTAQFRSENLQDTPIAITAVKGERLEDQGIKDVQDLGYLIPNANFIAPGAAQGPNTAIGMRGVNTSEFIYTTDPGVGVYIDDVYHGTLTGSDMDLMDIDRVEVLRGPQGTLFGKNSLGGAIRLFSKQPKGDNSGAIDVTTGTSHRLDIKGSYDFKLADNLFVRVAGVSKQIDGYQKVLDFACQMKANGTPALAGQFPTFVPSNQENTGDCQIAADGGSRSNAGRVMFRYLATDDLEFNVDGDYTRIDAGPPADTLLTGYHPGAVDYLYGLTTVQPMFGVLPDDRFATPNAPFTTYAYPSDPVGGKIWPFDQTTTAYSGTGRIDYSFSDGIHLKFIGAYRKYDSNWLGTLQLMPIDLHNTYNEQHHAQQTYELRLTGSLIDNRLAWTAGTYYYDSQSKLGGYVTLPAFAAFNIQNFYQNDRFTTKSKSGFLHGEFKLSDPLTLTAGLRYTSENKTYAFDHTNFLTVPVPLHYGSSHLDYKLSLDYRWNPSLMTYALVSTGFRSDGAQPRPFTIGQQQTPTTAEKIRAYELGLKTDFFDRRVRANLAAFLNVYNPRVTTGFGLQCNLYNDPNPGPIYVGLQACPPTTPIGAAFLAGQGPPSALWFYYTSAPGKAKGVELEVSATPFSRMEIDASGGFYTYSSDVAPTAVGYVDASVREQPRFSGSAGVQYAVPFTKGSIIGRLDMFYHGYRTDGPENLVQRVPDDIIPGYTLFNARVTYESPDGRWMAALAAENLFDKFYWGQLSSATNIDGTPADVRQGVPGRGREFALTLRRTF
jgi:iron complex outermembrane receptor protein